MLLSMRTWTKLRRNSQPVAHMSIFCRGKPISRENLFAYTNGHFLVDEEHQLERRYREFNVDALCDVARAAGGSSSRISTIEKLEGGFSKAFLMTKEDGSQVMAKIPCYIAGPVFRTTASEVGTLQYIHKNTGIPVPQVFSWSADASNPVGAEYIIMEKAHGVPLFQQWGKMPEIEKLQLIKRLTQLEAQLSAIAFPAYCGLYLQVDANRLKHQKRDVALDEQSQFFIGPSPERSFAVDEPGLDQGPWDKLSDLGISIARRGLCRISNRGSEKHQVMDHLDSIEEQSRLLETTITVMKILDSHPRLVESAQPTLWHTDLHMGNIFVSPDDSTQITSLIDVQCQSILPLFLQAQWPVFLQPPREYTRGFVQPSLPNDFGSLDEDEKAVAMQEWAQSKVAKAYEVSTFIESRAAHTAMNVPRVFRELFIRAGDVSEAGAVPLRECLIEIFQNWSELGFPGQCSYSFSHEEISNHERQFAQYREWNQVRQLAQECLDTDAEGWIAPQLDFAEKRRHNRELLSMYIERAAGEKSPEEARRIWPFPDEHPKTLGIRSLDQR